MVHLSVLFVFSHMLIEQQIEQLAMCNMASCRAQTRWKSYLVDWFLMPLPDNVL